MTYHAALRSSRRSATGVYIHACVYVRLMYGQGAWPASRRVTFTRSCSLLLARSRSMLLFSRSKLLRTLLSSTVARAHHRRRGTVHGTASLSLSLSLSSRLAPRSNLNYHFTLPFERVAAAATAETQAALRLAGLPFIHSFFIFVFSSFSPSLSLSLSLSPHRRTLVLEIDEIAHCARAHARDVKETRVLIAIFNAPRRWNAFSRGGRETLTL